ncbi:MAG TPA: ribonuclease III domain-containing protein [Clostridia bacterium]|nr:ribonuclease III domain-containing protein [Clostridia bacterium]
MKGYLPIAKEYLTQKEILELNPLVLAFVGDSVQQLMVRTKLSCTSTAKAGELHKLQSAQIKASAQAKYMDDIMSALSEDEIAVFKRARNTHMNTMAKHASVADYKKASGFEAVIGYLYLLGENERLEELFDIIEKAQ